MSKSAEQPVNNEGVRHSISIEVSIIRTSDVSHADGLEKPMSPAPLKLRDSDGPCKDVESTVFPPSFDMHMDHKEYVVKLVILDVALSTSPRRIAEPVHKLLSEFDLSWNHTHKHASLPNITGSAHANLLKSTPFGRSNKKIPRLFKLRTRLTATLSLILPPATKLYYSLYGCAQAYAQLNIPLSFTAAEP